MLSIVKKNNYFGCFGTGKGTYALDQSGGPDSMGDQNNFVKVSSHHELKSHSIGMSPYTPVIVMLNIEMEFQVRRHSLH